MDTVSDAGEELWASLPDAALHPIRVPIVEALWWVHQPLSALGLVDVLDGALDMWEARYHLEALEELGVAEPVASEPTDTPKDPRQDPTLLVPYRLTVKRRDDG